MNLKKIPNFDYIDVFILKNSVIRTKNLKNNKTYS